VANSDAEITLIRNALTREASNDAYSIAQDVFKGTMPDVSRVSNEQLDARYHQAILTGDRQYLQAEAARDPAQFMASMKRLIDDGRAVMPPDKPLEPQPALPQAAKANVPVPKPPAGAQAPTFAQPDQVPAPQPALPMPPAPAPLAPPPPMPAPPPPGVIPAMASGGVVTQPTLALIGEQGPEAVVPLSPDPDLTRHLGGVNPANPQPGEIQSYIDQAARARGIDPATAMTVAYFEGGRDPQKPEQPAFTDPAIRGTFSTGSSWWPFQLHYGGQGYSQYGTAAGLGNEFTQQTGYQPGDPAAWRASVDFALDAALKRGWYPTWYGSKPGGVTQWQGIPGHAQG